MARAVNYDRRDLVSQHWSATVRFTLGSPWSKVSARHFHIPVRVNGDRKVDVTICDEKIYFSTLRPGLGVGRIFPWGSIVDFPRIAKKIVTWSLSPPSDAHTSG